jgi:hypothetical protein
MRGMDEAQAWEQLYGRRSPDVRVIGRDADSAPDEDRREGSSRGYVEARDEPPASAANAA